MRLVKLDFTVIYCIAVVQVEAVACVGCTHQHVGAIALFLGDPKLIIPAMIAVDLDLSFVSDFIAPNVKHKVVVDYATDDDFPVFVGYLPFLGIVVSPLPELDIVIVVRLAIFEGKDVVGVLGKLDDVFAVGNVVRVVIVVTIIVVTVIIVIIVIIVADTIIGNFLEGPLLLPTLVGLVEHYFLVVHGIAVKQIET